MTTNHLVGLILIVMGMIDLLAVPTLLDTAWRKAKQPPPWAESLNMVVRVIGIIFIVFGVGYYFFGQLEPS
jgi:hypothetical protein